MEIRHKAEIHQMTGRVAECPVDEMNRPRGAGRAALRIPPSSVQVGVLFGGWRAELATCRKFAPAARSYAAARLMADVGLRVNEASHLDLTDIKWDLGRFGKLHVRMGKGARGSGPRERMVPLINGAGATLRWFVQDVWSCFDDDHARPGAPLFCSERRNADGSAARAGNETLRSDLAAAAAAHLPDWTERVTPHVLRHFCASQLYLGGMDLIAIQETLGDELHSRPRRPCRGRLDRRPAAGGRPAEGTGAVKWNLRLAAANRGIWKASELQRMLAEAGLKISAGKMSGLWSGRPASVKLSDLDVICAVVGCGVEELLIPEPAKIPRPADGQPGEQAAASPQARPAVTPRRRDGRSLPPA
jgi:DNA-binding Xre family transcriptional regulator